MVNKRQGFFFFNFWLLSLFSPCTHWDKKFNIIFVCFFLTKNSSHRSISKQCQLSFKCLRGGRGWWKRVNNLKNPFQNFLWSSFYLKFVKNLVNESSLPILIISMKNEREQSQRLFIYYNCFYFSFPFLFENRRGLLHCGVESICDLWLKCDDRWLQDWPSSLMWYLLILSRIYFVHILEEHQ